MKLADVPTPLSNDTQFASVINYLGQMMLDGPHQPFINFEKVAAAVQRYAEPTRDHEWQRKLLATANGKPIFALDFDGPKKFMDLFTYLTGRKFREPERRFICEARELNAVLGKYCLVLLVGDVPSPDLPPGQFLHTQLYLSETQLRFDFYLVEDLLS